MLLYSFMFCQKFQNPFFVTFQFHLILLQSSVGDNETYLWWHCYWKQWWLQCQNVNMNYSLSADNSIHTMNCFHERTLHKTSSCRCICRIQKYCDSLSCWKISSCLKNVTLVTRCGVSQHCDRLFVTSGNDCNPTLPTTYSSWRLTQILWWSIWWWSQDSYFCDFW